MPTDTEIPDSPASFMDAALPNILGDEQDAANADAVLDQEEAQPEGETTDEAQAEAEGTEDGEEGQGEEENAEQGEDRPKFDKKLQQKQQDLANREKALVAATEKLEKLAAKLEANPTAANQRAVEQAQQTQQDALAEAEALLADPSKFDAFEHTPKLIKSLIDVIRDTKKELAESRKETTEDRQTRAAEQRHNDWWNQWGQKNADIGRARGEKLWEQAGEQAKAEQKAALSDGLEISLNEAAKAVFRRLVKQERVKGKPAPKVGEQRPAATGGRLGPANGRAGNQAGRSPRTLDDQVRAGEFNLSGSIR